MGKDRIRWRLAKDKDRAADDDVAAADSGSATRLPTGRMVGNRIEFDLAETQRWVRHVRASLHAARRPARYRDLDRELQGRQQQVDDCDDFGAGDDAVVVIVFWRSIWTPRAR